MSRNIYAVSDNVNLDNPSAALDNDNLRLLIFRLVLGLVLYYPILTFILFYVNPVYAQEEDQETTWTREPWPRPRR